MGQLSASKSESASYILMIDRGRVTHLFISFMSFWGMLWRIIFSVVCSHVVILSVVSGRL